MYLANRGPEPGWVAIQGGKSGSPAVKSMNTEESMARNRPPGVVLLKISA